VSAGLDSSGDDGEERDSAKQGASTEERSIEERLSKDVASWSRARSESLPTHAREPSRPAARRPPPQPPTGVKAAVVSSPAAKPAGAPSRPFRMSYGGVTTEEYIEYMLDRGVR